MSYRGAVPSAPFELRCQCKPEADMYASMPVQHWRTVLLHSPLGFIVVTVFPSCCPDQVGSEQRTRRSGAEGAAQPVVVVAAQSRVYSNRVERGRFMEAGKP